MECRQHKAITDKLLKQPFFYGRWYVCACGWRYNAEEDKIFNKTSGYQKIKSIRRNIYNDNQSEWMNHLKSIMQEE